MDEQPPFVRRLPSTNNSRLVVFCSFVAIGIVPWTLVNGIFAQLPVIYSTVPSEASENIASWLSISVQLANTAPLLAVLIPYRVSSAVGMLCTLALACSVCLAVTWKELTEIGGRDVNLSLLILTFFAGVVGCLGNVTFWPFASKYDESMITALGVGMGASNLIGSILSLIQDAGKNPRFSSATMYLLLAGVFCCSLVAFRVILSPSYGGRYLRTEGVEALREAKSGTDEELLREHKSDDDSAPQGWLVLFRQSQFLCFMNFFTSGMSMFMTGVSTYLVANFDNGDSLLLYYNTSGAILGTLSRISCSWIPTSQHRPILLALVQMAVFVYFVGMVNGGGNSPFNFGGWGLSVANGLFHSSFGINNSLIFKRGGETGNADDGFRTCRILGYAEQAGATVGTLSAFLLANLGAFKKS